MDRSNPTIIATDAAPEREEARVELALPDLAATRRFAATLAPLLRPGDVLALSGELGCGKTELVRAMIRALAGAEIEVPSPTFTLVQRYELAAFEVWHADLYRLAGPDELAELGLDDIPDWGVLLVEWPERAGTALARDRLDLVLAFDPAQGEQARVLELRAGPSWRARLLGVLGQGGHG